MPSHRVLALPQGIQLGDKVRIKGIISNGAEEFSINFANEACKNPDNITYHFKWILAENLIVEDYKRNGEWIDYRETEYDAFDGRLTNSLELDTNHSLSNGFKSAKPFTDAFTNSCSIAGLTFALEFAFNEDGIYVYLMYDNAHNMITHYEPEFTFSDIQTLQVWGDVDKIDELTFIYN